MASEEGNPPIQKRRLKLRIPQNIRREHIIQAIEEIKKVRWPPRNNSTTYDLFYQGERYPPKIVVMYANKHANGELFDVSQFSGGEETTNKFFRARDFEILPKKEIVPEFRYIDPQLSRNQYLINEKNKISLEREYRIKMWKELLAHVHARNLSPDILREQYRIYRGAAGIWYDKERTTTLSDDGNGITVSVLHTGKSYPDDVGNDSIIYHYPTTNRSGNSDQNEINATKNCKKYHLPLFIITYSKENEKRRDIRLGYVADWNDDNRTFLINFSESEPIIESSWPIVADTPFDWNQQRKQKTTTTTSPQRNPVFRFNVLKRYGSKCAVCSIKIDNLLSASHIIPVGEKGGSDDARNGIVLCHNHHRAFDDFQFSIDPSTFRLIFRPNGPTMTELKIETDSITSIRNTPHIDPLQWRYKKFLEDLNKIKSL